VLSGNRRAAAIVDGLLVGVTAAARPRAVAMAAARGAFPRNRASARDAFTGLAGDPVRKPTAVRKPMAVRKPTGSPWAACR